MSRMGAQTSQDGWTLVEVLVALSLLSLLTALLTIAIGSSRSSLNAVERRVENARGEFAAMHLRQVLSEARPLRSADQPDGSPIIAASATALRIVSAYSPAGQYAGLHAVDLFLQPRAQPDTFDLVAARSLYRAARNADGSSPQAARTVTILLSQVAAVRFQYFGSQDDGQPPYWSDQWKHAFRLPALISIEVTYPSGDRRNWQDLIVDVAAAGGP